MVAGPEWYFVCSCGAKWFHHRPSCPCPRCGHTLIATERHIPPWEKPERTEDLTNEENRNGH